MGWACTRTCEDSTCWSHHSSPPCLKVDHDLVQQRPCKTGVSAQQPEVLRVPMTWTFPDPMYVNVTAATVRNALTATLLVVHYYWWAASPLCLPGQRLHSPLCLPGQQLQEPRSQATKPLPPPTPPLLHHLPHPHPLPRTRSRSNQQLATCSLLDMVQTWCAGAVVHVLT